MLSRHFMLRLAVAALVCAVAASPAPARAADDEPNREGGRAVVVYLHGGAFNPLAHLDDGEYVDFDTAFSIGGGSAYRINRHFALRGNFMFVRSNARDLNPTTISPLSGNTFNRYLYDADVQFRYPFRTGVTPYVFAGGGGVTVQRDIAVGGSNFTKRAGKVGLGLSYLLPKSNVGVYAEGAGWIYKWDRYGFDNVQFDTTITGGISYRFGL